LFVLAAIGAFVVAMAPTIRSAPAGAAVRAVPIAVPSQSGEVTNSWALTPSGDDPSQPGERSNLSYTLAPGATIEDFVTLWNYGNVALTFDVYATDAVNNDAGSFTLLETAEAAKDVGSWVKLGLSNITLPASTSVRIPITLTVPSDATPGDHAAGIVASSLTPQSDDAGNQVLLDRRVGTRLYLRVPGPVSPQLEVESITTSYHSGLNPLEGTVDVEYRVRNSGNVRLGARQEVSVSDLFGTVGTRRPERIEELLPGQSAVVRESFDGVAATFRISTEVALTPTAPSGGDVEAPAPFSREQGGWAIPWTLLGIVALLLLAAVLFARARRRRQVSARRPVAVT